MLRSFNKETPKRSAASLIVKSCRNGFGASDSLRIASINRMSPPSSVLLPVPFADMMFPLLDHRATTARRLPPS